MPITIMKAVRYQGPRAITIETLPTPTCGEGEVVIAMKACGVCGTDVKTYMRGHPLIPPGAVLGHEVAGVVLESRHPQFTLGDRVAAAPYTSCMTCPTCRRGHYSLCEHLFDASLEPGGFAEVIRVPKRIADQALLRLPDSLDLETASLTEPLACCFHGAEALGLMAEQSLLILGDGPMGLLQAALGKALGAAPVILSGMTPHRLELAAQFADVVIDASKQTLADELRKHLPRGPEKVFVSVGDVAAAQEALQVVARGGAVNLFAGMPKDAALSLPLNRIHYDEVVVLGTFGFGPQHFSQAFDVLATSEVPFRSLFTRRVSLDEVQETLEAASRYEIIKAVVIA
ncbi:MAG: alcohol dehydrogenase catalytic domain-containing protein [Anaerolineae bacterium]|nr:alcohol dehydrogenase catalytic domain-containing protein [Anaerolineae bacterium]